MRTHIENQEISRDREPNLFQRVNFLSHSGKKLDFKIECDSLTQEDIDSLAYIISKKFMFSEVHGVPNGGVRLAKALEIYKTYSAGKQPILIVDDVLTTGGSMLEFAKRFNGQFYIGVVLFARGECPEWVNPVFQMWHTV